MLSHLAKPVPVLPVINGLIFFLIFIILAPAGSIANAATFLSQSIPVLAVATDDLTTYVYPGLGQVVNMTIDVEDGNGRILVNTNINSGGNWQKASRTSVHVAETLTHHDLSSKDVIFTAISTNASRQLGGIDGPSAGAAMTVLLASELEGKRINNYTMMTGTVNPDGTIGKVGGVLEKAVTAGKYGIKVLLVPAGQAYYPQGACVPQGDATEQKNVRICVLEFKSLTKLMGERYNMKVVEVHNVQEALGYFQSTNFNDTFSGVAALDLHKSGVPS